MKFDEGRNLGDIAGRPDGKAYKNVPNKPDRGAWAASFQTKVDGNLLDADKLGYAGLTTENTYPRHGPSAGHGLSLAALLLELSGF